MLDTTRRCVALSLLIASIAPASTVAQEPSVPQGLSEALAYITPTTANLGYTDWTSMKASHGLEILDSSIPEDLRIGAMIDLTSEEAIFSSFGLGRMVGHAEAWGWDSSDLGWEATTFGDDGVVSVLHFRDGIDLQPFIARLDERGFDSTTTGDVVVRSHPMDLTADWSRTTDLGILNLALMPDGRTVVASSSPDALAGSLAARATVADSMLDLRVDAMSSTHSAFVEFEPGSCAAYDPRTFDESNTELIGESLPLQEWDTLSLFTGHDAQDEPVGELRLTFPGSAAEVIEREAEARSRLANEGISSRTGAPYADSVYSTDAVVTDETGISFSLRPVDTGLQRFAAVVFARDLLPAMCGV